MIPGINQRKMAQMMKRMGIQQTEIAAKEVIIKTEDKEIIITSPQVSKVNMMGQQTFQVIGNVEERPLQQESLQLKISQEDIQTVMEQTGKSEEECRKAIEENKWDLAKAILSLKEDE